MTFFHSNPESLHPDGPELPIELKYAFIFSTKLAQVRLGLFLSTKHTFRKICHKVNPKSVSVIY